MFVDQLFDFDRGIEDRFTFFIRDQSFDSNMRLEKKKEKKQQVEEIANEMLLPAR